MLFPVIIAGVSLEGATADLLDDGIRKFVQPFEKLLAAVEARTRELAGRGA